MLKNLLFFIARVAMIAFGSSAFAYDWSTNSGNGTPENPYQISSIEQLTAIGSDDILLSRHFVLTADIDLLGVSYPAPLIAPDIDMITPDFQGATFSGTFDGQSHSIHNLNIAAQSGRDTIGLFGKISNAKIQNLTLMNVSIQAPQSNYVAALIGQAVTAQLNNCHISGTVAGKNYLAGLVAYINSAEAYNSSFEGTVTGSAGSFSIGGLIGASNPGTIRRCQAAGSILAENSSSNIGGLLGYIRGTTVESSLAEVAVSCGENSLAIGGLIGTFDFFSNVQNCYSLGSINAPASADKLGGLIGNIADPLLSVQKSYSACTVIGGNGDVGGLIGNPGGLTPTHCYFLAQADGGGPNNGAGSVLTAAQMKIKTSFVGFDFLGSTSDGLSDPWRLCSDGVRYPSLSWLSAEIGDFACPNGTSLDDVQAMAVHWLEIFEQSAFSEACDADGDGKIDLADEAILSQNWQAKTLNFDLDTVITFSANWLSTSATWEQGDYTGDGKVDLADWAILAANYHSW